MKALVLFSGGIDSTTVLGLAIQKYGKDQVIALSVSYGQKHDKEIKAAIAVAQYYGVEHLFLDLSKIFQYSNCSLLQQSTEDIPEESYAEQISKTNGDKPGKHICTVPKRIISFFCGKYRTEQGLRSNLLWSSCR